MYLVAGRKFENAGAKKTIADDWRWVYQLQLPLVTARDLRLEEQHSETMTMMMRRRRMSQ
jgi:hypothetical protein